RRRCNAQFRWAASPYQGSCCRLPTPFQIPLRDPDGTISQPSGTGLKSARAVIVSAACYRGGTRRCFRRAFNRRNGVKQPQVTPIGNSWESGMLLSRGVVPVASILLSFVFQPSLIFPISSAVERIELMKPGLSVRLICTIDGDQSCRFDGPDGPKV